MQNIGLESCSLLTTAPLQVVDCDLEADSASSKLECSHIELGWGLCDLWRRWWLLSPRVEFPESRIQLAVGILIVKNRYGVCPQRDAGELTGCFI